MKESLAPSLPSMPQSGHQTIQEARRQGDHSPDQQPTHPAQPSESRSGKVTDTVISPMVTGPGKLLMHSVASITSAHLVGMSPRDRTSQGRVFSQGEARGAAGAQQRGCVLEEGLDLKGHQGTLGEAGKERQRHSPVYLGNTSLSTEKQSMQIRAFAAF